MADFTRQIAQAQRGIVKYGEACIWSQPGEPVVADPAQPWIVTAGVPLETGVFILFTLGTATAPWQQLVPASPVPDTGLKAIMAAQSFVPAVDSTVIRSDGTKLLIKSIDPLAPAGMGQVILYRLVFKS